MIVQNKTEAIKAIRFFRGLTDEELDQIANLCGETSFAEGEICQTEGLASNRVNLILKGRVGTVIRIPNITSIGSEIILDVLRENDMFGWSSLIKGTPWSTLKTLEPVEVMYINAEDLLDLCERNSRIGYIVMRNLSSLIASRLRRNRMSMLNAIVAIKGEW
jgi:CRP-like cAMP-binding protein